MQRRITVSTQTIVQLVLVSLLLVVSGCAPLQPVEEPPKDSILPVADSQEMPVAIRDLMTQADRQYKSGQYNESVVTLERALRIKPRFAEIWTRLAMAYSRMGQHKQALQSASRSNSYLRENPKLKDLNDNLINAARAGQSFE